MSGDRVDAIDALKAIAIVTVVAIHSFPGRVWVDQPSIGAFQMLARFAVPAFLFASGFLIALRPPPTLTAFARTRLPRLLGPYLTASAVMLAVGAARSGSLPPLRAMIETLLLGHALPIYYYVPMLTTGLVVVVALLAHRPRWFVPVAAVFTLGVLACELRIIFLERHLPTPLFWTFRNPLRWWGHVMLGAATALAWPRIAAWSPARSRAIGLGLLAALGVWFAVDLDIATAMRSGLRGRLSAPIVLMVPLALTLALRDHRTSRATRLCSDLSYPIYLYHLPVVRWVHDVVPWRLPGSLAAVPIALAVTVLFGLGARRLLGARARTIVG